ncbi:hypothetical protein PSAB6_70163 [Paraburkholderia sabiae]|nr:hypothetical protein PSAB6_70163 [Paraburkholderia sabiae]
MALQGAGDAVNVARKVFLSLLAQRTEPAEPAFRAMHAAAGCLKRKTPPGIPDGVDGKRVAKGWRVTISEE